MALYKVVVACDYVEIPVAANSAEEAMEYMRSTDEWHEVVASSDYAPTPIDATKITHPNQSEWSGDALAWGNHPDWDEHPVAIEFYGCPKDEDDDTDNWINEYNELMARYNREAAVPNG